MGPPKEPLNADYFVDAQLRVMETPGKGIQYSDRGLGDSPVNFSQDPEEDISGSISQRM